MPAPTVLSTLDSTAGLLSEAVDLRQAKPGTLAHVLGREERLERARLYFRRHADAVVGDGNPDELACYTAIDVFGRDRDDPAVRHRVAGVHAEVDDSELELARVDLHRPHLLPELHPDLDVAAERSVEHRAHAGQVGGQVDRFRIHRTAPRERQQVPRQPRSARDGTAHRRQHPRARRAAAFEQLQGAGEHRQQVVEVVRHAAGELPERFHFLRLPKRFLRRPQPLLVAQPLGDVVDELVGADLAALAVAQRVEAHFVRAPFARRIAELLDGGELLAGERAAPDSAHRGLVIRLAGKQVEHAVANPRPDAEDALEFVRCRAVDGQPPVFEVRDLHERAGALDDVGEQLPFGEPLRDAALERFVQLAQRAFRENSRASSRSMRRTCRRSCRRRRRTGEYENVNHVCSS